MAPDSSSPRARFRRISRLSGANSVAEVRRDGELVAVLTPGAVIGEVAFLLGRPRTADVVAATEEVRVLTLNEGSIRRQIRTDPELSSKLLLNLCRCLCARVL